MKLYSVLAPGLIDACKGFDAFEIIINHMHIVMFCMMMAYSTEIFAAVSLTHLYLGNKID